MRSLQTRFLSSLRSFCCPRSDRSSKRGATLLLFLEHEPLAHPELGGRWSHAALLMTDDVAKTGDLAQAILTQIKAGPLGSFLVAVDLLRLQPGLDLVYPAVRGREREGSLMHTVEYVFSDRPTRDVYYQDQYIFSGPAMRDLYQRDKAGRFLGFEVEKRLFTKADTPAWDVFHVVAFTPWQMVKAVPFFYSTWTRHARRVHGPGATLKTRQAAWEQMRINVKGRARQQMELSLQAPVGE